MRKTITERLTTKYQIIVRNEENFADKWAISLNLAKVLAFLSIVIILLFVFFYYFLQLFNFIFSGNEQLDERKALLVVMAKVDSLEQKLDENELMVQGWKTMMNGGSTAMNDTTKSEHKEVAKTELNGADAEFVKAYEKVYGVKPYEDPNGFTRLYFTGPLEGGKLITEKGEYNVKTSSLQSLRAISDGIVLQADTIAGALMIQHKEGLITTYSGVKGLLVKPGNLIKSGQSLSKELNSDIGFSMYYRTRKLNPSAYISFRE